MVNRVDSSPTGAGGGNRGHQASGTMSGHGNGNAPAGAATLATKPSLVEWRKLRFVIMDAPKENNLHLYLKELKRNNVSRVVRVCEPTYPAPEVEAAGMQLLEMEYDDGHAPPPEIISKWLDVVHHTFKDSAQGNSGEPGPAIAVHCVAGLGRAPVLVAIALIEHGQDPMSAVEYIRARRRGAINLKQLSYLESYERQNRNGCASCAIM